jgi:hypothetical protein
MPLALQYVHHHELPLHHSEPVYERNTLPKHIHPANCSTIRDGRVGRQRGLQEQLCLERAICPRRAWLVHEYTLRSCARKHLDASYSR